MQSCKTPELFMRSTQTVVQALSTAFDVMLNPLVAQHHMCSPAVGLNHQLSFNEFLNIQGLGGRGKGNNRLHSASIDDEVVLMLSLRSENPFFGTTPFSWVPGGHDTCVSQVSVAADYSDSVPDSSSYVTHNGYHPLEELKDCRRVRDTMPTSAEIARTAVEANKRALLMFPGTVHCEPHEQISWSEFQYVIDDFGDIFFEIYDGQNILQDQGASNPVNFTILILGNEYGNTLLLICKLRSPQNCFDDIYFADEYFQVEDSGMTDIVDWGMPNNSTWIHPVYFAKCLTKVLDVEHAKFMDHPSNGVALWGFLKPTFLDEEFYLRQLFNDEDSDGYTSDSQVDVTKLPALFCLLVTLKKDFSDGDTVIFGSREDGHHSRSTIYRLEITKIELYSVYGIQALVGVQDFQYAEPDVLVHSIQSILERFGERGTRSNLALKALCKKKGLNVEGANLIGVDSLGMDVRVSSGTEVRTHRFSFKIRATSECAADKQIRQLLFPRSRRKKLRTVDRGRDIESF
ncbi:hypothetical protein BUALT_Bualt14G0024000 [Buddleja alternifolia]|uniref:Uncharacterized protein n=1 Tax=Buddleja alternifolia TaxID=168488 RepID=A0AAV6WFM3_9LAMI|nr:hypothetical protein BUALT_Bualt14G0024000 [Buddleja alternifolia]